MRTLKVLSLVIVATLVLSACGGGAAAPAPAAPGAPAAGGTIKIGVITPLTGDNAAFGNSTKQGLGLAVEEWNAKGGILGNQIQLIIEDGQCKPDPAVNAANKLINQDGVKFIIGEVCSSASIPIAGITNPKKVIQISSTSTNPGVTVDPDTKKTRPYTFRACFIDPFQGIVGANFALKTLNAKTAAVLLDQGNDYVRGLAEFFRDAFEKGGGKVVVWETYTANDTDFSAILTKVAAAKPDFMYLPDYYNRVGLIAKQAREKGITAKLMGGDGWDSPELDRKTMDGGFYTSHYAQSDMRPIVQDWVKKFKAKYNIDTDANNTLAYDAATILFTAIKNAGTIDDTDKVKAAMEGIDVDTVSGKTKFDSSHNPIKCAVVLEVKGGKDVYNSTVCP